MHDPEPSASTDPSDDDDDWNDWVEDPRAAAPAPVHAVLVLSTTVPVAGGAALARDPGGRVVFVTGALPGEQVEVELTEQKKDFARAVVTHVVEPSPDRIEPPCPHVADGCGGCDLQHAAAAAQPEIKRTVVLDALRRLGHLDDPVVELGPFLATTGFRTTVRCGVVDGRAGFRLAKSHDILDIDHCLVAHPRIDDLIVRGDYDGADEVVLRVGAHTGEAMVVAAPTAGAIELPDDLDHVLVFGEDELAQGKRAWIHEVVHGHRFRISAHSFFQTRPDGAAALVDVVRDLGGDELRGAATVLDAYGGVGLFGALAAPAGARVILVEASRSATIDARQTLEGRDVKIIRSDMETWRPATADVVIADPSRDGLGKKVVASLAATEAGTIVLVSCDAAALGRDARLLTAAGYRLERSVLVDLFPQTHHVEVVSRFVRAAATGGTGSD